MHSVISHFRRKGFRVLSAPLLVVAAFAGASALFWYNAVLGLAAAAVFLAIVLFRQRNLARNIRSRLDAEQERREIESRMQQARHLESLGVLAGGIAHDFNNLLQVVLTHADLAELDLEGQHPVRNNLVQIRSAAYSAADLCRQLLAYAGQGARTIEPVRLESLADEVVKTCAASSGGEIRIEADFEPGLPPIEGDGSQLRQLLVNLVTNASEAVEPNSGSIAVRIGFGRFDGASEPSDGWQPEKPGDGEFIRLEVEDTGSGMAPETLRRVFEPFFTTRFVGRGLGMPAVLGLVRRHHGFIHMASHLGRGTTVRVFLPGSRGARIPGGEEIVPPPADAVADQRAGSRSGVVLLVDDDELVRIASEQILRKLGFEVLLAENGLEALEVYRSARDRIGLVLLDLTMPELDGWETLKELRQRDPGVRVVICSGYSSPDIRAGIDDGFVEGFLEKPFTVAELRRVLRRCFSREA